MDFRPVHDACRLAIEVARAGELAEKPVRAPAPLRRMLTFKKLSATAYATIATVIDEDDDFRRRVAEAADENEIGRAGWLWLVRPDGWETDLADAVAAGPDDHRERAAAISQLQRERDGAQHAADRAREAADAAELARKRSEERLAAALASAEEDAVARRDLRGQLDRLESERRDAIRQLKAVEAELADTRHDLKVARKATQEAEAELVDLRRDRTPSPPSSSARTPAPTSPTPPTSATSVGSDSPMAPPPVEPVEPFDRSSVRRAIDRAAAAAAELATSLAEAGRALATPEVTAGDVPRPQQRRDDRVSGSGESTVAGSGQRERRRRSRRRPPKLPFGVLDDTPEAHRALVSDPTHLLLVDGYNLARTLWTGQEPIEERRRTVSLLEELQARTGAEIAVVFDGEDDTVAPAASRTVKVRFSPTGVTADDVLVGLVAELPEDRTIVVVSSDREVAEGARASGAAVLQSADFAAAVHRR